MLQYHLNVIYMEAFVVRHASTDDGEAGMHQNKGSVLSIEGIAQAKRLAKSYPDVEMILTSTDERARQTATIVSSHLEKPVEVIPCEDLREMTKPPEFVGKKFDAPQIMEMKAWMMQKIDDPDFRLPGAENIFDVRERVVNILGKLENLGVEKALTITHSAFIRVLYIEIFSRKLGKNFLAEMYPFLRSEFNLENGTGLGLLYAPLTEAGPPEWRTFAHNVPHQIPLRFERGE